MMGHVHAELMAQYAEDALETETPWERWECRYGEGRWMDLDDHPKWALKWQFRRKPRTITINGREVPEPMRTAPEIGTAYYICSVDADSVCFRETWNSDAADKRWLSRGLCHSTKEAAIAHAQALLSFTEAK